ncbi:MAG: transporter [Deferribacteraceae bacterium]|jgi:hypothetical protein|nr:transporter [Deferribacteraceae bacterium]
MRKLILICIFLCFSGSAFAAQGIHYAPLDGVWAPAGTNFAIMYMNRYSANKFYTDGKESKDRVITQNVGALRLGRFISLPADMMLQPSLIIPFGDASLDNNYNTPLGLINPALPSPPVTKRFTTSGVGDPELNIALRAVQWNAGTYFNGYINVGGSIIAPLGNYDSDSPINLGSNRWTFRPLFGVGQNFGPVHIDINTGSDIFTDNKDVYGSPNGTLRKYTEYWSEAHITYFIVPETRTYASISFGGLWGGREEIDYFKRQDWVESYALRLTMGTTISKHVSMYAYYQPETAVYNGPKGNMMGIRFGIMRLPDSE